MDIAMQFRNKNIQVAMGEFHPSGSIAMLPEIPKEIQDAMDNGVAMFAGEAEEERLEALFDRIIHLRENQGFRWIRLTLQVDTLSYKIPNFVLKAVRAGCKRVFIGLESVNPENLKAVKKNQNNITEYRKMFKHGETPKSLPLPVILLDFQPIHLSK